MSLQLQFVATRTDAKWIAQCLLCELPNICVTDECSDEPGVYWRSLDIAGLESVLVGTGGYIARDPDIMKATRHERERRGYPLDRSSTSFIAVNPSGVIVDDTVRMGRLFLYEAGDTSIRCQFKMLQKQLRKASTLVPGHMGARIFPDAKQKAKWLGGVSPSVRFPNLTRPTE
jgi:hypothetical protein